MNGSQWNTTGGSLAFLSRLCWRTFTRTATAKMQISAARMFQALTGTRLPKAVSDAIWMSLAIVVIVIGRRMRERSQSGLNEPVPLILRCLGWTTSIFHTPDRRKIWPATIHCSDGGQKRVSKQTQLDQDVGCNLKLLNARSHCNVALPTILSYYSVYGSLFHAFASEEQANNRTILIFSWESRALKI